jgi:sugar phosphate isomerase/epimerase
MYSRREFAKNALTGISLCSLAAGESAGTNAAHAVYKGVRIGAITGSLGQPVAPPGQDIVDIIIRQCIDARVGTVELVNTPLEPRVTGGGIGGQAPAAVTPEYEKSRDELRQWRINGPLDRFREIRRRFDAAGLNLYSFVMTIGDDFTEPEIDAVFRQMQALGVDRFCTNQSRVSAGPRIAAFAEKYKIMPAWHTHQLVNDPNEVASPESLAKLLAMSKYFMVNLDIGHFADGGNNPMKYFLEHHDRITHVHVKDVRSIGGGPAAEVGEGVLRIYEMLRTARDKHLPVAFLIERTYLTPGFTAVEETRKQIDWMERVLDL